LRAEFFIATLGLRSGLRRQARLRRLLDQAPHRGRQPRVVTTVELEEASMIEHKHEAA
jgi:hypothetical protein